MFQPLPVSRCPPCRFPVRLLQCRQGALQVGFCAGREEAYAWGSPSAAAVTVTYDASAAPTFSAEMARSAQIWNGAVSNVKLQAGSSDADFSYREGNDSRGS